jgi:serine/threonine-protein kinase
MPETPDPVRLPAEGIQMLKRATAIDPEAPTLAPDVAQAQVEAPATSGTRFGNYELLGELGRGGMGVVYKARQRDLDRIVALKMILGNHLASEEQVRRFHTEARAIARLRHPHIVQVYESGQVQGQHYFAMEYVEGQGLDQRLRNGPLAAEDAVRQLLPVVAAVAELHRHGILHRDLKPANILLGPGGRPVLADFGLAKLRDADHRLTCSGAIVGTPSYMAPEQAAGKEVGPASDVYSLGAILYEMVTGRPPFRASTPLDTLVQVLEGEPTLPRLVRPEIPRPLELVCLKCLEKAREGRYPDASALHAELERFLNGDAVGAQPQGLAQRFVRWTRREPALAAHLGTIALGSGLHELGYQLRHTMPLTSHLLVQGLLAVLALVAVLLSRGLRSERWSGTVRYTWAALDVVLLTAILHVSHALDSPLVVLYPLYIGASGLWFQVRLVGWATFVSELGYATLLTSAVLEGRPLETPHRHAILMVALALQGFITAYQVQRMRVLSSYYEGRPGA